MTWRGRPWSSNQDLRFSGGHSCAVPVGTDQLATLIPRAAVTPGDPSCSLKAETPPLFLGNLLSSVAAREVSSLSPLLLTAANLLGAPGLSRGSSASRCSSGFWLWRRVEQVKYSSSLKTATDFYSPLSPLVCQCGASTSGAGGGGGLGQGGWG